MSAAMNTSGAIETLSALAHASRLAAFRALVRAGPDGLSAGALATDVDVLPNTLSTHLAILERAGLVGARRAGRSIIYTAQYDHMRTLLAFLMADCCAGRPEICAPLPALAADMACVP
jgi:DNA-binding transcriptional ArsR family regulator